MKPIWPLALLVVLLASQPARSGTPGVFRGTVVPAPAEDVNANHPGWLYVEGRNHLIRRVAVGRAAIVYGDEIPQKQRTAHPELSEGTEVRVTADQDSQGEWHALRIEILGWAATTRANRNSTLDLKISETAEAFSASNRGVE